MNRKKLGFAFMIVGFLVNFVACILLIIPFITQKTNKTLTMTGGLLYICVAVFIITGALLIIFDSKKKD